MTPMTTTTITPTTETAHAIPARFDTVFQHEYPVEHPELRRLYENAKRDQWNVSRDIDWKTPVDLEKGVIADELIDIYGTPYWHRLSAKDQAELNRRFTAWRLSLLLHGEHGAMLVCSQLVAETFAVALFKMLGETAKDPLFKEICRYILQDESRHMGFGMLSLPGVISKLSEKERIELEDFTHWALVRTLTGLFPSEVYRDMGFSGAEIQSIQTLRRGRAAGNDNSVFRTTFKRDLHTTLLQNLARVGLLTDRIAPKLESLGISVPARKS